VERAAQKWNASASKADSLRYGVVGTVNTQKKEKPLMDYLALHWENLQLRKLVLQLQMELQEERDRSFQSVELLMKGEALRQRMMLDAIIGRFPPKVT
jgi:hypothetical protein